MGAYYFDGWAGQNAQAGKADWAKDAPTHLTKRMLDEFPDREPVWGWRDDKLETMERIVLVYAWNEFGEGGYIAPTKGDAEGKYLRALKEVILPTGAKR